MINKKYDFGELIGVLVCAAAFLSGGYCILIDGVKKDFHPHSMPTLNQEAGVLPVGFPQKIESKKQTLQVNLSYFRQNTR